MADEALFQNPLLFGRDLDPNLVSVEFDGVATVWMYQRQPDGSTRVSQEAFEPYLWSEHPVAGSTPLQGGALLGYLTTRADWKSLQSLRSELRTDVFFALNDPVQQFLTRTGKTLFKTMDFADLRRMQVAVVVEEGELRGIALSDASGWEEWLDVDPDHSHSERTALERLNALITERDPDVLEGHHFFKIDLPFLAARAKKLKMRLNWGRDGSPMKSRPSRLQIAEKTIQYPRFSIHGRHVVDTFILAQMYDVGTRELDSFGLDAVADHFGVSVLPNASDSLSAVRAVRAVSAVLSPSYFVQSQIFPYNYQDVIVRGNATKINALFLRAYLDRGYGLPGFPEVRPFEGGYTDIFFTGVAKNVWHCDVASLYPSVMLTFGLLPQTDLLGIFGGMLSDLRNYRMAAKARVRTATDENERRRFDALQSVFKILINSFYGYLGFAQGHFADFEAASAVTAKGRELLRMMVAWLEESGAKVIEIDTDGIYFIPPPGATADALDAGMRSILPPGIEVEFDQRFVAMFSYKAKNYALLGEGGEIILKGAALKSRGMEPYLRDFLLALVRCLLEDRAAALPALHAEFAQGIRSKSWPIQRFAKTEALQDSLAAYRKKIESTSRNRAAAFEVALRSGRDYQAGDSISYYITGQKKKVTAYDHARPVADWSAEARDENVEYYAAKLDELYEKFSTFAKGAAEQQGAFGF